VKLDTITQHYMGAFSGISPPIPTQESESESYIEYEIRQRTAGIPADSFNGPNANME
jgi:hypothetical protein